MSFTAVIGGSKKFRCFLEATKADVRYFDNISDVLNDDDCDGIMILPNYDEGIEYVPQFSLSEIELLAERKRGNFRIYAENYDSFNTYNASVFGYETIGKICHITNESVCAFNGMQHLLSGNRVMQAAGAAYIPAMEKISDPYAKEQCVLLKKGHYVGTSQIVSQNVADIFPVLIKTGSVYSSLISLSNFDTINFRPNIRWKKIYVHIFSYVLNVSKEKVNCAFEKCFPPLKTKLPVSERIKDDSWEDLCKEALKSAVSWHYDSGIVLGKHGESGAIEMIMSSNGQRLYSNRRVDSGLYTGWLLYAAGKHFKNEDWTLTGKNIFDYFAEKGQIEAGREKGLYRWYYNENAGPHCIYSIDCGRDGISLCNMYRLTGDKSYLERIKNLADGFCRWVKDDLLYSFWAIYEEPPIDGAFTGSADALTPGVYGEMISFMIMASKLLDNRKYMDTILKITDNLANHYPNYTYHGHTTSARNARLLLLLLCVQHSGERDYSELINKLIDYLETIQLPCGGIYCEDNITYEQNIDANCESGIVAPWEKDKITDQLYVTNNALAALSVLMHLPNNTAVNKEKGLSVLKELLQYVIKIQIVSDDKRFNGGWMRAFSVTHEEYYGLDLDRYWGSYCIMAGWTMGIIPLAILSELTGESPYIIE